MTPFVHARSLSTRSDAQPTRAQAEGVEPELSSVARFRAAVFRFWDAPESSTAALYASILVLTLILISTVTFIMSSVPRYEGSQALEVIEWVCVVLFTIEYLCKLACAEHTWRFVCGTLNLVDLIAIAPFWLELALGGALGGTAFLRVVRLVRVFRVLKLGGRFEKMQVVANAMAESFDMLGMLAFLLLLTMVIFSSLVYYAEYRLSPDPNSEFHSIPASFWWCIVTLMTVGYGDSVPVTPVGQVIAGATMVASIIIMALPISVIGTNFTQQWVLFKDRQRLASRQRTVGPQLSRLVRLLSMHNLVLDEVIEITDASSSSCAEQLTDIKRATAKVRGQCSHRAPHTRVFANACERVHVEPLLCR